MGRHMIALWCQSCTRGRVWSIWSICSLPSGVLVWIYGFLDVVSGSRSQRCNWKCLRTPLAEARVMPLPRFMSINNVVPPPQSLYITRVNRSLHEFAVKSAGTRSLIKAVYSRIKRSRAVKEHRRPVSNRACRQVTLLVVGFQMTLAEALDESDLELMVATRRARRVVAAAYRYRADPVADVRIENYGAPRHLGRRARASSSRSVDQDVVHSGPGNELPQRAAFYTVDKPVSDQRSIPHLRSPVTPSTSGPSFWSGSRGMSTRPRLSHQSRHQDEP